jgi:hypothetical protein
MPVLTTKQQLLDQIQRERTLWEALLAEIRPDRMELPGVTGDWTMKDTIAHLTTWWRWDLARMAAAQRGERPSDHPPQSEVAVINEWVCLTNRDRPLPDVLRDAQAAWQQLEAIVQALPEATLLEHERFAWMGGQALGPGILDDFVHHFHEEHEPLIRSWLRSLNDH